MTPDDILRALSASPYPEAGLMREAMRQAPAILPVVVATIDEVAGGALPVPRQEHLLCNGVAALAAARRTEIYRPILQLCRVPPRTLEFLLGNAASDWLKRVVVSTCDGDPDPLVGAVMDRKIDGFMRWSLMSALARLGFDGKVPRRRVVDAIDRFEAEGAGGADSAAWMGWANMILLLGLRDHADRMRVAWRDGRIGEPEEELEEWLADLERAAAAPDDPAPFEADRTMPIDDPMDMIESPPDLLDDGEEDEDETDGPQDPAEDVALSPAEEGWLSIFLDGIRTAPAGISLEQVEGFMSGLANGPTLVGAAEGLRLVEAVAGMTEPTFASEEQRDYCNGLLLRLWQTIELRARHGVPHHPCVVALDTENAGRGWARGFRMAVQLDMEAWTPLIRDKEFARLLVAVIALDERALEEVFDKGQVPRRMDLVESLPLIAIGIGAFWAEQRESAGKPIRSTKVGRNVPCPCGSGRKFKHCCGKT